MHVLHLAVSTIPSVILLAVASSAIAAQAAEAQTAEASSSWGMGVGAISSQQPYSGIDRDNKAIPLIYFENEYLRVFGPNAEVKLTQLEINDTQQIDFSLVGQYDFSGYDADDSRVFDGMSDRKSGFWAGPKCSGALTGWMCTPSGSRMSRATATDSASIWAWSGPGGSATTSPSHPM